MKVTNIVITSDGRVLIYINEALAYSGLKTDRFDFAEFDAKFKINNEFEFAYDPAPVNFDIYPNAPQTLTLSVADFLLKMSAEIFTGTNTSAAGGGATESTQGVIANRVNQISGKVTNLEQSLGNLNDLTDAGDLGTSATVIQLLRSSIKDQRQKNTGGIPKRIVAAAGINATVVKASSCAILGGQFNSRTTGTKQVRIYNWALSAPNPTTNLGALVWSGAVSGIGTIEIPPIPLSLGLSVTITAGATDTDTTAVAANSCSLFLSHT